MFPLCEQWSLTEYKMETVVDDPDLVDSFDADEKGRITLGTDFANEEVKVAVERRGDDSQ